MIGVVLLATRILDKCIPEPNSGCWLWLGASQPSGYGQMWNGERPEQAHRISYRVFVGEIPDGTEIDHRCNQPCCVNPEHLQPLTHRDNMRRGRAIMGVNARKTECLRGHPLSGPNLRIVAGHSRQCRLCDNIRAAAARQRRRAA